MNLAVVIGRLGCDPERRNTKSGADVCSLRVATDFTPKGGEARTEWHDIVVWGDAARACAEHLSSGRMVAVQGRLQTRSWDDAQGHKKWRTEIVAHRVDFLPGGGKAAGEGGASAPLPF